MRVSKIIFVVFFLLLSVSFPESASALSGEQTQRLEAVRELMGGSDGRSLEAHLQDLQKSPSPEKSLQIMEAVARVYDELIREYALDDFDAQKRLLERIRLNMAHLQLGGMETDRFAGAQLDILINRKLRNYLSPALTGDREFFHSLEKK